MKRLRQKLRAFLATLLHEHASPGRVAVAVLLGCIVGCTPLLGLHLGLCVLLAWLFGLNKLVLYGAANLSIPPLLPLVGLISVELGERLRHGRFLPLSRAQFADGEVRATAARFFVDWMLGGVILGVAIGLVAGGAIFVWLSWRQAKRAPAPTAIDLALATARCRYDGLHPRFVWYARLKYRLDPCYRALAALVPPSAFTVDLGTGLGMLPVLLGLMGEGRCALGIEWDAAKLACGRHAARELDGVEVIEGDARLALLPACDVITLVDMLHYWDAETQRALLQRCRAALRPGGRLLVREGDPARKGGARLTRAVEWVVTRLGWNRGPQVRFRPLDELSADLVALGFSVRVEEVAARTHPGNVLVVAELPSATEVAAEG